MACSCPTPDCVHKLPCDQDVEKLKCLYKEYYLRHGARLPVKILDKEKSRVHDFYQDTRTIDRVYLPEQIVSLFGPFDPYTFNQIFWGIDRERSLIFTAATPLLEDLGIEFKAGDLITYHGVDHEILTVKRKEDSYFDQHDYSFEWAIATYVPNRGS